METDGACLGAGLLSGELEHALVEVAAEGGLLFFQTIVEPRLVGHELRVDAVAGEVAAQQCFLFQVGVALEVAVQQLSDVKRVHCSRCCSFCF